MNETQRRRRGHIFVPPADVRRRTPALNATEATPTADKVLWVKWFAGSWTWYAAEVDWDTGTAFGFVDGLEQEWGYFDLAELERTTVGVRNMLVIERDCWWTPCTFAELTKVSA